MKIGELASTAGVSTKTIRYYESIDLLAAPPRTAGGYREYDDDAVERLHFIRDAQSTGLSLTEIKSILELKEAGTTSCEHTRALLRQHLATIDEQLAQLRRSRTLLASLAERADHLDPSDCTDPNRCQVIFPPGGDER